MKRTVVVGLVVLSIHDTKEIEIVTEDHGGFEVVEIRIRSEKSDRTLMDVLVVKCFVHGKGYHVRKLSDSLVERLIQVKS